MWEERMDSLVKNVRELVEKVVENNRWRQRRCVNLIPSENTPSLLVKLCEIGDPSGRYAEHKTALKKEVESLQGSGALKGDQVYYYQGTDFIYEVEQRLKAEFGAYIGGEEVETRPVSGQMANEIVFKAVLKFLSGKPDGFAPVSASGRIPAVMNNGLNAGGHLSAQPFGALFNFVDGDVVNFPLEPGNPYKIDVERMLALVDRHRPPLVITCDPRRIPAVPGQILNAALPAVRGNHPPPYACDTVYQRSSLCYSLPMKLPSHYTRIEEVFHSITHGIGAPFVFWFVVSVVPSFIIYTIPVSFLIGVLVAFTRLSSDSEITAMKASGLSLFSLMKPVIALAFIAYLAALAFTVYFFPWGNINLKNLLFEAAKTRLVSGIEEKTFYDKFSGVVLYVDRLSSKTGEMEGIFISEAGTGGESNLFFAERGIFSPSGEEFSVFLKLYNGTIDRKSVV